MAACENPETKVDLVMYFTVNLAFVNYFEGAIENLNASLTMNWTTQEQILSVSIENYEYDPSLLSTPKMMKDLATQYKYRKEMREKNEQKKIEEAKISSKLGSFLNSFLVDVLLFIAALTTLIITLVVMYMVCGQSKLKVLIANLALQHTKAVEATDPATRYCICEQNGYIVGLLLIILFGITCLVMNRIRKSCLFKGCLFSNMTKIMLFMSNTTNYVPIKFYRIAGSIHLFKIRGRLSIENVRFKRNWIWDVLEINWHNVGMTLNGNDIDLPSSVVIPLRDKFKARKTY